MTRKYLPAASAENVADPAWLQAKILHIAVAADEFAAKYPDEDPVTNRRIAYEVRVKSLAADIRVHTEPGHRYLAELREQVPECRWLTAAGGFGAYPDSDDHAAQIAEKLGLPEQKPLGDGRRHWEGRPGEFTVRLYGPDPTPEEDW